MDDDGLLECTQALPDDWDDDGDGEPCEQPELVAWLEVGGKKYEVFEGETKIGRDPSTCKIVLTQKVLSKEHAALEVTADVHTLVDLGSMNKTRIGKMPLKPNVRYALQGGENIRFGDVPAKYIIKPKAPCEDSGSETGSESMLHFDDSGDESSSVLNPKGTGLDTSNIGADASGSGKNKSENTFNDSDFVPETQEDKKRLSAIGMSPSVSHKTIIPESPNISQSTPRQEKRVSFVTDTPGNVSAIQDVTSNSDSFFFEPSQPKSKSSKEKQNDISGCKGDADYDSDASTDIDDEDIATQLFEDSVDNGAGVACKSSSVKESRSDDDICFQPTQLFTGASHQMEKDEDISTQDVLNAFGENVENPSLSTTKDDDDDYVPTQLFFDDENDAVFKKPVTSAPKSKKRSSGGHNSGKTDEDLFDDDLLAPTQPYGECSKILPTVSDEKDVYDAPTQLFSEDTVSKNIITEKEGTGKCAYGSDDEDFFNQPTQLFGGEKELTNVHKDASKISDKDKIDDDDDDIYNQPTQAFDGYDNKDADFFDAPTQLFEEESPVLKKQQNGSFVQENEVKNSNKVVETSSHFNDRDKTIKDLHDDGDEDLVPTQLFEPFITNKESSKEIDCDEDLVATQVYDPSESKKEASASNDSKENQEACMESGVFQTPTRNNTISDEEMTPTQVFKPPQSAVKTPKRLADADDDLPPTQIFEGPSTSKDATGGNDNKENQEIPMKNVVFQTPTRSNYESDEEMTPTQVFKPPQSVVKTPKRSADADDDLPPTQIFESPFTSKEASESVDDDLPPTQYFSDACKKTPERISSYDSLPPTQPYSTISTENASEEIKATDELPATVLYSDCNLSSDSKSLLSRNSTKSFTIQQKECLDVTDDKDLLPTQPYLSDTNKNLNSSQQGTDKATNLSSKADIAEAPTQPYASPNTSGTVNLQRPEEEDSENADGDATQDITFDDRVIGIDGNQHCVEQFPKVLEDRNNAAWDDASDSDSDASENLLDNGTVENEDNVDNSKMEFTEMKEQVMNENENDKKGPCIDEDYHSDESTDIEDEPSINQEVKESNGCSDGKLIQNDDVSHSTCNLDLKTPERSTLKAKASLRSNETQLGTPTAVVRDVGPGVQSQNASPLQSTPQVDKFLEFSTPYSYATQDMMDIDVRLYTQDESTSDMDVRPKQNKEPDFSSSDSDSEDEKIPGSPKIFELTPSKKTNVLADKENGDCIASGSKAKRKLPCGKTVCENDSTSSECEESPKKKQCNIAAKNAENKSEKAGDNEPYFSGFEESPQRQRGNRTTKGMEIKAERAGISEPCSSGIEEFPQKKVCNRTTKNIENKSEKIGENEPSVSGFEESPLKFKCNRTPKVMKNETGKRVNETGISGFEESPQKRICNRTTRNIGNEAKKAGTKSRKLDSNQKVDIDGPKNDERLTSEPRPSLGMQVNDGALDIDDDKSIKRSSRQTRKRSQESVELNKVNSSIGESKSEFPKLQIAEIEFDPKSSKSSNENKIPPKKSRVSLRKNVKQDRKIGRQWEDSDSESIQSNSSSVASSSGKRTIRRRTVAQIAENALSLEENKFETDPSPKLLKSSKLVSPGKGKKSTVSPRKSRGLLRTNIRQEEKIGRQREDSDSESVQSNSSSVASSSGKRTMRRRTVNPGQTMETELSLKKNKPETETELDPKLLKSNKLVNPGKTNKSKISPRKSRGSLKKTMKQEEKIGIETENSDSESVLSNSSSVASSRGKRTTRQRKVNLAQIVESEMSLEKTRPNNQNKIIGRDKDNLLYSENLDKPGNSKNDSYEKKIDSAVTRNRGRNSRNVTLTEAESQNSEDNCSEGGILTKSLVKEDCGLETLNTTFSNANAIETVEGSSSEHSRQRKCKNQKSIAEENSAPDTGLVTSEKVKVDLEKGKQTRKFRGKSSLTVIKEGLGKTEICTKDVTVDEVSGSASVCYEKMSPREKNSKASTSLMTETIESSSSDNKKAGVNNEVGKGAATKNLSHIRASKRTRRGPDRFSPDRDSQSPVSTINMELPKITSYKGKNLVEDTEDNDLKSSEDVVPSARKGKRGSNSLDRKDSIAVANKEENPVDPSNNDPNIRRGRASIATSQPSLGKSIPKTRARLSQIPSITCNTRRQEVIGSKKIEGNTKSKSLQSVGKDSKKLNSSTVRRKRGKADASQEDSEDSAETKEFSTDCSELNTDSEYSQDSVESKGRKTMSTESLPSTPKCRKRESLASDKVIWSPSRRQLQASNRPRVLFTGYKDVQDEKIVLDLGGKVVESAHECTVLVTTAIKRTCKLLAVMGKGMPIVTPAWLNASKQARNFIDPWGFLVKDPESETKYGFRLEQSLRSASKYQLFEGLEIHATKSVKPPPEQMKEIVECSGGQYLDMPPKRYSPQIRIVSCPEDKGLWTTFRRVGIPVLGTEFILTGLLRHQLLLDEFVLT